MTVKDLPDTKGKRTIAYVQVAREEEAISRPALAVRCRELPVVVAAEDDVALLEVVGEPWVVPRALVVGGEDVRGVLPLARRKFREPRPLEELPAA